MESSSTHGLLAGACVRRASRIRPPVWFACAALVLHSFAGAVSAFGQPAPSSIFDGGQPGAHFGFSVASAGDVNGDGFSDVLVGAPEGEDGQAGEGIARLYLGSSGGLLPSPAWTRGGDQAGARFGFCVASAGDVNGDGYSDVLVGAPAFDVGLDDQGAAFLFLGSAGGLATAAARVWFGSQAREQFGGSVASAGDVDADGFADVLIGAPGFDGGQSDEGAAYLFRDAATLPAVPAWSTEGNQAGAALGRSLAALGDMNGDGFGDVAIGAPLFDGAQIDQGQVQVFAGNSTGLDAGPLQSFQHTIQGARFGFSIAGAGNLAGDGRRRVLFGAPFYVYTHIEEGGTFLGGLGQTPFFLDFGRQDFAHRGSSIASAGDVNGDGLEDVVIGADQYDQGELDEGVVTVHAGHPSFVVDRTPLWVLDVDQASCAFGFSVASAGDVNGDGYDDVVAGAPRYDHQYADEGRALVFLGPSGVTAVGDERATSGGPAIRLAGANPFRASTSVTYSIPRGGRVEIAVLDVQGRRVARLVDETKAAGAHVVSWNGRDESGADCGPGVYLLRMGFERGVTARKAVRLE